jgi:cell division septation protein DedD
MDIKFNNDSEENQQPAVAKEKGNQNLLLVVLLVLVCGFGYVYFFTGIINPQQEQKPAEAPAAQVVKKPLPSPDGQPAKAEPAPDAAAASAAAKTEKTEPPKAAAEPKKAEAPKPAAEQKKAEVPKVAEKKPAPAVAKVEEKKPAPAEKKAAVAQEKKALPVAAADSKPAPAKKPVEKKAEATVAAKKDAPKPERKAVAAPAEAAGTTGNWTVLVGNYVLEEALVTDLVRVRKAGLEASVVPAGQKKTKMNRLLLAEFADRESAQAELAKLKRHTSDAFIIDSAGKHTVYAGSYLLDARAGSEKERLAAAGFNLSLKRADVSIASKNLTSGVFADKKTADENLKKLKAAGINASVVRQQGL